MTGRLYLKGQRTAGEAVSKAAPISVRIVRNVGARDGCVG